MFHRQLKSELRKAVCHLDDPEYIESLPLVGCLQVPVEAPDLTRGQAICRRLRIVVDSLAPGAGHSSEALDPHRYEILYRYANGQQSMAGIAAQLAISERQAYRELHSAMDAIVEALDCPIAEDGRHQMNTPEAQDHAAELSRLSTGADEEVDLVRLTAAVVGDMEPLAIARGVSMTLDCQTKCCLVKLNRVMLRQALLNFASHVMGVCSGEGVILRLSHARTAAWVQFAYSGAPTPEPGSPQSPLGVASQLCAALGVTWDDRQSEPGKVEISIRIPTSRRATIVIVDDNEDLVALFRRYLRHQPYDVHDARNLEGALALLEDVQPDVIILDILMPDRDGWEVLQGLRERVGGQAFRLVVCSIINDPQLRIAMRADAFLNKPVGQRELLRTLASLCSTE